MRIEHDYDLSAQNTFRMKVRCACYVEYDSVSELENLPWDDLPRPLKHIGSGSNLLFTGDFPGTILHSRIMTIKYVDMGLEEVPVIVGSGVVFDDFIAQTCSHGLWGAENLSYIPGEVGASAVQNIGAYGVEAKDIISGVVCYDVQERCKVKFQVGECGYGYRESMFKHASDRYIVTSVLFRLSRKYSPNVEYKGVREALAAAGAAPAAAAGALTPQLVRDAIIAIRRRKLPEVSELGSAGSFFKNPVIGREQYSAFLRKVREFDPSLVPSADAPAVPHFDLPDGSVKLVAAWLIDRAGFKGAACGGAAVYENQPLVIVNASGSALPSDVVALERRIIDGVRSLFGILLSPEVEHL